MDSQRLQQVIRASCAALPHWRRSARSLGALGIPLGGLALLLGVDRIPDMVRTATQVTGHLAAAVVVERLNRHISAVTLTDNAS